MPDDKQWEMIRFIGTIATQLSELAKQVDDPELKEQLEDIADQCSGEFFGEFFDATSVGKQRKTAHRAAKILPQHRAKTKGRRKRKKSPK